MGKIGLLHLICTTTGLRPGGIPQGYVIKVVEFVKGKRNSMEFPRGKKNWGAQMLKAIPQVMLDWEKEHCGSSHRREVPRVKESGVLLYTAEEVTVAVVRS